jgi:hypothetical protein
MMPYSESCWPGLLYGAAAVMGILLAGPALALLPPAQVQEQNLGAAEILVGLVEAVRPAPGGSQSLLPASPPGEARVFTLAITHVVKSQSRVKVGEPVEVLFVQEEVQTGPLARARTGISPVRVVPGDLVMVYADPVELAGRRFLKPLLAGLSVVRLGPPPAKSGGAPRQP